jgi:hypothetical protein
MKNRILGTYAAMLMFSIAAPASADNIVHLWNCKLNDGKNGADVVAASSAWLKAAKSMKGGKNLEAFVDFPVAANTGDGGFNFVLIAPDIKTWGVFNNDYSDSPAAKADEAWAEVASCSGSSLWQSVEIE